MSAEDVDAERRSSDHRPGSHGGRFVRFEPNAYNAADYSNGSYA